MRCSISPHLEMKVSGLTVSQSFRLVEKSRMVVILAFFLFVIVVFFFFVVVVVAADVVVNLLSV